MSTSEKIASVILGILLVVLIIFSYREFKEPPEGAGGLASRPQFSQSLGQNFKIGAFATVAGEQSSGGPEDNCVPLHPVIIAALHDIQERLEAQNILALFSGRGEAFEVNEHTLQLFCNKNAEITLADNKGNKLVLQKIPFTRGVPPQGSAADIGTEVRINATLVPAGASTPPEPTTYGDILIPDRFLDTATSSGQ